MERSTVRTAGPEDEARVLAVVTLAFAGDPFARWVTPDAGIYFANMPASIRAFGGNGFAHGTVFVNGAVEGAAMWLPPGVEPDFETLLAGLEAHTEPERLPGILAVLDRMSAVHPEGPVWYLPMIGVDPARQGCGIGEALMRHALARIDADGLPAYLESSNPRNIPFYRRLGFKPLEPIQVGDSPELVPMLRPPR